MKRMHIEKLIIDWSRIEEDSYLREISAIKDITEVNFKSPITFFCGENGTGKSTLLEAIAVSYGFNPEGGSLNYNFSTHDSHSELYDAVRLIKGTGKKKYGYFLRAESFYNVATKEMEYVDERHPSMKLHEKSHGESFLTIAQESFSSEGLFILDEPEAALSPQRQLTLLIELNRLSKAGAQFIIVSHSPILLGMPGADILSFDDGEIHRIDYKETESYIITELFINNGEQLLRKLFDE